ncbi:O-antigen ligase family protein [Adhaeribacter swui]|uniref:O-antigen ligase family protein n=1 Tax=Adhaeribacter swui TaxID=2086471 RepID=A0A7G7GBW7_9BACT|nr:O-antigen ligase family protein [Adhaeribacter swui]QNF34651.1 O-antigen ligase family protein [Adhaeribacter swui]
MIWPESATGNRTIGLFWAFSFILLASLGMAIYWQNVFILVIPLLFVVIGVVLTDYSILYYLLLIAIPFSVEVDLPNGLGTDLFSEPLIILLAGCTLGSWLLGAKQNPHFWKHSLIKMLLLVFMWAVVTTLFSENYVRSVKYLLAKSWYLLVFVFLTSSLLQNPATLQKYLYFFMGALGIVVGITLLRHAQVGFSFGLVNKIVAPFLRNHVAYGALAAAALPFSVYLTLYQKNKFWQALWGMVSLLLLAGVAASYTRASWLSLPLALAYALVIRFRLTRYLLLSVFIICLGTVLYFSSNYRYMQYAPEYEKTIFNQGDITKHLKATYTLRDVSGMERVYRWIAAARMVAAKPVMGHGPNSFYPEYFKYTVSRFTTYVSDNPEKSTVHNYFLLQFAEQGYPGGILFLILMGYALLLPEKLYHRAATTPEFKKITLAAGLCFFIITVHLFLNELVETDKIGFLFYFSLVVLIRLDIWTTEKGKVIDVKF